MIGRIGDQEDRKPCHCQRAFATNVEANKTTPKNRGEGKREKRGHLQQLIICCRIQRCLGRAPARDLWERQKIVISGCVAGGPALAGE